MNFINGIWALILLVAVSCVDAKANSEPTIVKELFIPLNGAKVNINNIIIIDDVISRSTMAEVNAYMNHLISDGNSSPLKELHLILNSPGGSVGVGFNFINKMKTLKGRGTKVSCYVPDIAASMAFGIFVHCDKRFVLAESMLLWHRARIRSSSPMTSLDMIGISKELMELDLHILQDLYESPLSKGMDKDDIVYHFDRETFHLGKALCSQKASSFCSYKDYIPGLFEALNTAGIVRTKKQNAFEALFGRSSKEIIYIQPGFLEKILTNI